MFANFQQITIARMVFICFYTVLLTFILYDDLMLINLSFLEAVTDLDRNYIIFRNYFFTVIGMSGVIFLLISGPVIRLVIRINKPVFRLAKLFFGVEASERDGYSFGRVFEKHEMRIEELESQVSLGMDKKQFSQLQGNLSVQMEENFLNDVTKTIEEKFSAEIKKNLLVQRIEERFENLVSSLDRERSGTTLRSGMNLIIGIGIALFGIIILYGLLGEEIVDDEVSFLKAASRISVAIIIEVFAYFFLNLYRIGLQDIRYFRNEITNVMSQRLALETAIGQSNDDLVSRVIARLADTERNFVLKKGETTIGLSQNNSDREQDNAMLKTLSDTFTAGVASAKKKD